MATSIYCNIEIRSVERGYISVP